MEHSAAPVEKVTGGAPKISANDVQNRLLNSLRAKMPVSLIQKMAQASTDILGQRREVTTLCVEIVTEEQDKDKVTSEELYLAYDELLHLLTDSIYRYEGIIDQLTGQGMVALFGIPINHENDPERAVRAALEMVVETSQIQAQFEKKYFLKLRIRAGIHTGSVITGTQATQQHVEYTVVGDTISLARELQAVAAADQILTSFETYQRVAPIFEFDALTRPDQLGYEHRNDFDRQCYQPLRVLLHPGQMRGIPGLFVPLVGRVNHLEALQEAFGHTRLLNESQIALISGEAGMGKSRLVSEFRRGLEKNGVQSYWGTCASYMRITPYRVVGDLVRNMLNVSEMDTPTRQRDALMHVLMRLRLDKHDILPHLLLVLGLLQSDPVLDVRLKLLEPVMLQRQTHLALRTLFSTIARQAPIILIFDDLHWVDQSSQQFLEYLCQALPNQEPLFLVLVSRDFDLSEPARLIAEASQKHTRPVVRIALEPLSDTDSLILVNQLIREETPNSRRIKETITQRAAGNPFYTEELVRILIDHGGMIFENEDWRLTEQAEDLLRQVPGTLQDILLARFDRLSNPLRQLVQKASILGDLFAIRLLKNIYAGSLEELRAGLEELRTRDFLTASKIGNDEIFIFKHPLLKETIYRTLLKRDLRNLHYEIGMAIENGEHWLPGERNQILAWHFSESRIPSKAVPYLLTSAEQAFRHFAHSTVSQLYRQALALMNETAGIHPDQINQVKIGLAQAIKYSGHFEEASKLLCEVVDYYKANTGNDVKPIKRTRGSHPLLIESLRELADIRTREGDLEEAVHLLSEGLELIGVVGRDHDSVQWRRLADRLAWVFFRLGKLEEAYNMADMALLDVKSWESDDPITLASLYNTLGGIYWTRLRYQEAIESVERSLAIYQNLEYQWGKAIALTNLGVLNYSIGKWPECIDFLEKADQIRSEFGHHPERPINLVNLGEALVATGDFVRARRVLENSLEISKRLHSEIYQAYTHITLAQLNYLENKLEEAQANLEFGWTLLEPLAAASERAAQYLKIKALLEIGREEYSTALESCRRALEIIERGGFVVLKMDVLRVLGVIYARSGNHALAEKQILESIQAGDNLFSQAQGLAELGVLYVARARANPQEEWAWCKKAESALDQAIGTFEKLGARYDLRRAQVVRSSIPSPASTDGLVEVEDSSGASLLRKKLGLAEGEWYQATVLALSLVPNQSVDEEMLFETTAFLVPLLTEFIEQRGGQILRYPGGLIGVFGAPTAFEDDTERAVDTAMAISNFYAEFYQQTQLPVTIRTGIAMGKIVAGWMNQDRSGEFLAAGQPLQAARELADVTVPTRIWVTQPVRNMTAFRFEYSPVAVELVGALEERVVFQLVGELEQVLPVRGLIGLKAVFVGRQVELSAILEMAQGLFEESPRGSTVWIEGEPGIGKSRLTRELETNITPNGALVWRGVCNTRRADIAFSLFSDMLASALDIQPNFSQEQIYKQVNERLCGWNIEEDLHPFVEMLVGVQPSGSIGEQLISLEPEQFRRQTFIALHRLFSKLTDQQPLVLVMDDVQWIDATSADLLLYLTPLTYNHPMMMVCVQRNNEPGSYEVVLARVRSLSAQHLLYLELNPLSQQDCRLLLNHYLAEATLDETLKSLIIQQSGGNPYFIEEFVRMLMEQDYLRMSHGNLEVNQTWKIDTLNIPSSLENLIRARVDALPALARSLLQVAAVLGTRFVEALLAKVAERGDVQTQLGVLENRGMLARTSEERSWEFSHPMIEVIVYNTVLKAQRRILHLRTAEALEAQWRGMESEHAEELAYHFGKAEAHARTLDYLILAGERAASRYANEASVGYFEQANEMLSVVEDVSDAQRWRIISGLGGVYRFMGNYEAALITLQAGDKLIRNSTLGPSQLAGLYHLIGETYLNKGDLDQAAAYFRMGLDLNNDPENPILDSTAARLYSRLGRVYFLKADVDHALTAVRKAEELARKTNNLNSLAAAENVLGGIFWSRGEMDAAMEHTRSAMAYWQELGYTWGVAVTLNNLAILEANSGNWNAAAVSFRKALALRMEMGDVEGIALAHNNLANLYRDQGKLVEAETSYRASLLVSEPFQMSYHEAVSYNGLAQTLIMQGRYSEAEAAAQRSEKIASELEAREILTELKRMQAQIAQSKGDLETAEILARDAIAGSREINNARHISAATRALAQILTQQGRVTEGLEMVKECLAQQRLNLEELEIGRVQAVMAELYRSLGNKGTGDEYAQAAKEIFERLGAEQDLRTVD
jgi:predicted ATPase/class 3 adenylate cyclase